MQRISFDEIVTTNSFTFIDITFEGYCSSLEYINLIDSINKHFDLKFHFVDKSTNDTISIEIGLNEYYDRFETGYNDDLFNEEFLATLTLIHWKCYKKELSFGLICPNGLYEESLAIALISNDTYELLRENAYGSPNDDYNNEIAIKWGIINV